MNDFTLLIPEFLISGLAILVLAIDFFLKNERKFVLPWVTFVGLIFVITVLMVGINNTGSLYGGILQFDQYSSLFRVVVLALGACLILMSRNYVNKYLSYPGEFYFLVVITVLGGMFLASSSELLTAYISLELMNFGLYVLVAYERYNHKSNESGIKYVLLGAFSSAIILFGISQIYGLLGVTKFDDIGAQLLVISEMSPGLILGFALILAGIGFKVALVPFHMWAPDVYEGAPLPITAWLSVGSKIAIFAVFMRFVTEGSILVSSEWRLILILFAVLTMVVGNLGALAQSNLKRLLAYSSIGHVGYLFVGIAALASVGDQDVVSTSTSHLASNGLMFHLLGYSVANLAVFFGVILVYNESNDDEITSLRGLSQRQPLVALVMTCSFFSLAGLPVFWGFTSKFYLFNAYAIQGLIWVVPIATVTSLISLYYYIKVIRQIYIENPINGVTALPIPYLDRVLLVLFLVTIVVGGIYPALLLDFIQSATDILISGKLI